MNRFIIALAVLLAHLLGTTVGDDKPAAASPFGRQIALRNLIFTESHSTKRIDTEKIAFTDRGLEVSFPIYGPRLRRTYDCETVLPIPKQPGSLVVSYRFHISPGMEHRVYSPAKNGLILLLPLSVTANKDREEGLDNVHPDKWHTVKLHLSPHGYSLELNGRRMASSATRRPITEYPIHLHFGLASERAGGRLVLEAPVVQMKLPDE